MKYNNVLKVSTLVAGAVVILLSADISRATTLTWDSSGLNPTAPTDGTGNWDTTTAANWSNGTVDAVWTTGNTAVFGSNNGTANTVTIDDASGTVSTAGINFNAAGSGDYTIAASGADTLTLTAPITVNAGSPTIRAPIAGTAGLTMAGNGTLVLTAPGITFIPAERS